MKIKKIKTDTATSATFDFKQSSDELHELSARYNVKLVNLGALSGLDGKEGTMYLADCS